MKDLKLSIVRFVKDNTPERVTTFLLDICDFAGIPDEKIDKLLKKEMKTLRDAISDHLDSVDSINSPASATTGALAYTAIRDSKATGLIRPEGSDCKCELANLATCGKLNMKCVLARFDKELDTWIPIYLDKTEEEKKK